MLHVTAVEIYSGDRRVRVIDGTMTTPWDGDPAYGWQSSQDADPRTMTHTMCTANAFMQLKLDDRDGEGKKKQGFDGPPFGPTTIDRIRVLNCNTAVADQRPCWNRLTYFTIQILDANRTTRWTAGFPRAADRAVPLGAGPRRRAVRLSATVAGGGIHAVRSVGSDSVTQAS